MTLLDMLLEVGACGRSREWVAKHKNRSPKELWETCPDPTWMSWLIDKFTYKKYGVCAAIVAARWVLNLKPAVRPNIDDYVPILEAALNTAELWTIGEASTRDVVSARTDVHDVIDLMPTPDLSSATDKLRYSLATSIVNTVACATGSVFPNGSSSSTVNRAFETYRATRIVYAVYLPELAIEIGRAVDWKVVYEGLRRAPSRHRTRTYTDDDDA